MSELKPLNGIAFKEIIESLNRMLDDVGDYLNEFGGDPLSNSKADNELSEFLRQESILTAFSQGSILIEAAADFMMGFCRVLVEPVQTVAPWALARGILETSAISAWLFDPKIDARERVRRSFAFRYDGLNQQLKFARAIDDSSQIARSKARLDIVEEVALDLGYEKIINKKGKRDGIGQRMPRITDLISCELEKGPIYRLLSAITHAHPWALQQGGFRVVHNGDHKYLTKHMKPISVALLAISSAEAFSVSLRRKIEIYGWERETINRLLKEFYSVLDQYDIESNSY